MQVDGLAACPGLHTSYMRTTVPIDRPTGAEERDQLFASSTHPIRRRPRPAGSQTKASSPMWASPRGGGGKRAAHAPHNCRLWAGERGRSTSREYHVRVRRKDTTDRKNNTSHVEKTKHPCGFVGLGAKKVGCRDAPPPVMPGCIRAVHHTTIKRVPRAPDPASGLLRRRL